MALVLDAVGIVTGNLKESLRFYRLLGVEVEEIEDEHVEVTLPNGLRLMWDTEDLVRQINPGWQKPVGQRIGMAFLCGSPDEVNTTFGEMLEAGFKGVSEPWDAFWGQRYAQVADPDGNVVDLFAPLDS